jgi:hypothetical protein
VEKLAIKDLEDGKIDLTAKVLGGCLYGGYYSDYGKKGSYDIDNPAAYAANSISGAVGYIGGLGPWKSSKAYTAEPGTAMTPEANKTYFLKEVPVGFLESKLFVIYDAHNNKKVVHNYLISLVDDNNYKEIFLNATISGTGTKDRIKLAASYSVVDTFNDGTTVKINASTFGLTKGFVSVWKPDRALSAFDFTASWVTPDGVTVEGATIGKVTIGDGTYKGDFKPGNGGFAVDRVANNRITTPGQIVK